MKADRPPYRQRFVQPADHLTPERLGAVAEETHVLKLLQPIIRQRDVASGDVRVGPHHVVDRFFGTPIVFVLWPDNVRPNPFFYSM